MLYCFGTHPTPILREGFLSLKREMPKCVCGARLLGSPTLASWVLSITMKSSMECADPFQYIKAPHRSSELLVNLQFDVFGRPHLRG